MRRSKERPLLTISISGPAVKPGRIAIPVLLQICREAQATVNRQAEANEAKKTDKSSSELLHKECTLELIALKKGSTTLDFARAEKQDALLPEMAAVSIEAVEAVATTLLEASKKRGKWKPPDQSVLDALDELGSIFESGIDKVKWIVPKQNGHKRTAAEFVPATLKKVRRFKQGALSLQNPESSRPLFGAPLGRNGPRESQQRNAEQQPFLLEGMLENLEGKVRITPPIGPPAILSYGADKSDDIFAAVHRPVRVTTDPKGRRLVSLEVTEPTGLFNAGEFFESKSIEQLLADQNIKPISDLSTLSGAIPDEDVDEFVAEIYRDRKRA